MFYGVAQSSLNLLPEPDPAAAPAAVLSADSVLLGLIELGDWLKARSANDPDGPQGWTLRAHLVPFEAFNGKPLPLFPEPLGQPGTPIDAVFMRKLIELPGWWKVQLGTEAGKITTGWIEALKTPQTPEPARKADPPADDGLSIKLSLGINEVYREAILKAQAKTGVDAASLAALIDAEAGYIPTGPEKGRWDANAFNGSSGAAGLTQFIANTWVGHAALAGTALREVAHARGLVDASGRVLAGAGDALMQLRFDPALSIISAAEYGMINIRGLIAAGLVSASEPDDRKAWFMYLSHHEGLAGATGFLRGDRIYSLTDLERQVGNKKSAALLAAHGNPNAAYRAWLKAYIDEKIRPDRFRTGKSDLSPGKDGVCAYRALGEKSAAFLSGWRGGPLQFPLIGGQKALALSIQEALSVHGYLDPPADGEFGPVSQWAIAAFARAQGQDPADGLTAVLISMLADPARSLSPPRPSGKWIDSVIAAMLREGHFICRHPDCRNIVYVEGMDQNGVVNEDRPNQFNDCRIVFRLNADGTPIFCAWDATTEPGDFYTNNPLNPEGAARIAFGQYKAWAVGEHPASKPTRHEALLQVKDITIHRDFNRDGRRTGDKLFRGLFGVNQHWGYDASPNDIKDTSAGCLVGRTREGHRAFMAEIKEDARFQTSRGYCFMAAVLAGDRLKEPATK